MTEQFDNRSPMDSRFEHTLLQRSFGAVIRLIREFKRFTQAQLCELASIDSSYLSHVENGASNVSIVKIEQICNALAVDMSDVFKKTEIILADADRIRNTPAYRDFLSRIPLYTIESLGIDQLVLYGSLKPPFQLLPPQSSSDPQKPPFPFRPPQPPAGPHLYS